MKIIVRLLKREAIKDIFSIVILTLTFSIVYTLIVYGDFNFIEKAKNRETSSFNSEFREITIEEAQKYFNNALIIDARAEQDYASGHIPNSINISSKNFDSYIDKIFEIPQDTLIIIYCEGVHCNLSHTLAEKLKTFGFKKIWIMFEGIEGWQNKNLPIEK